MKKKILTLITGCMLSGSLFPALAISPGQENQRHQSSERQEATNRKMAYKGFIGGMMLHTGYLCGRTMTVVSPSAGSQEVSVGGAPFGIGGAIRFMFGKHLRIGAEGYVSTLTYGEYHSHAKIGWGGLLADCAWKVGNCRLFIGGTVGGGSQTNTTILSPIADDYIVEEAVSYRKYGFAAVAPFAGVEVPVNRRVNIVFKADWLLNVTNPQDDFVSGPRIYVGFMFGHAD